MKKNLKYGFVALLSVSLLVACFLCFSLYTHPTFVKEEIYGTLFQNKRIQTLRKFNLYHFPCKDYCDVTPNLNDRFRDYIWNSAYQKYGDVVKSNAEIRKYYHQKKLFLIENTEHYIVDTLYHSYAFLTKDAKTLLDEIGQSFQEKLKNTTFEGSKFIITSLLRTEKTIKKLMKSNRNSLRISSHLHGTSFDLAYDEFESKEKLSKSEIKYLKETLADVLYDYKIRNRCFVTYEITQTCFHVVNKKIYL
jgi:hypothetical protein